MEPDADLSIKRWTRQVRPPIGDGASLTDRPAVRYLGRRTAEGSVEVLRETADGQVYPLNSRTDLRHHSQGFEWGYAGSGPAQLALAILVDVIGPELAQEHYQTFKRSVVGRFPKGNWSLNREQVLAWLQDRSQCMR